MLPFGGHLSGVFSINVQTEGIVKQTDLQGVFVKIGDVIEFKGSQVEFLENPEKENNTPWKVIWKVDFFWASPFTMHLVCTLLIFLWAILLDFHLRGKICLFLLGLGDVIGFWAMLSATGILLFMVFSGRALPPNWSPERTPPPSFEIVLLGLGQRICWSPILLVLWHTWCDAK